MHLETGKERNTYRLILNALVKTLNQKYLVEDIYDTTQKPIKSAKEITNAVSDAR
jgi:hypothetical protein